MKVRTREATKEHAKEVHDFAMANGVSEACACFNINDKTVRNYISLHRHDRLENALNDTPKVFIFDIETSLILSAGFRIWNTNITADQIIRDWNMISWAGKWLYKSEVYGDVQTAEEAVNGDDARISKSLWDMIEEADIVIAHNGDKFDIKKMNTRFLLNGLNPPTPYKSIDTLQALRKIFSLSHNRLDYVNKVLGLDVKTPHEGIKMWFDVLSGKQDALDKMYEYNLNDVIILEELYLAIRQWIPNHPNFGVYYNVDYPVCCKCGSDDLELTDTLHTTQAGAYETYRCKCGAFSKSRKRVKFSSLSQVPKF